MSSRRTPATLAGPPIECSLLVGTLHPDASASVSQTKPQECAARYRQRGCPAARARVVELDTARTIGVPADDRRMSAGRTARPARTPDCGLPPRRPRSGCVPRGSAGSRMVLARRPELPDHGTAARESRRTAGVRASLEQLPRSPPGSKNRRAGTTRSARRGRRSAAPRPFETPFERREYGCCRCVGATCS